MSTPARDLDVPARVGDRYVLLARGVLRGVHHLDEAVARGPAAAFQCGTEFAHLHPPGDGSLHLTLPPAVYDEVLAKDWGEPHPISGTMQLFGLRDGQELETVWQLVVVSYRYAVGEPAAGTHDQPC